MIFEQNEVNNKLKMKKLKILYFCYIFLIKTIIVNTWHFYGGTLSASPIADYGNTVQYAFKANLAYTRSHYCNPPNNPFCQYCNISTIINKERLSSSSFVFLCRNGCSTRPVNTSILSFRVICISFSVLNNWSYGEETIFVNITKTDDFQASNYGYSWIPLMIYSSILQGWELRIKMNTNNRSDNNKINSTPYTLFPPVIAVRVGTVYIVDIPVYDADGDLIRCRWANQTLSECECK